MREKTITRTRATSTTRLPTRNINVLKLRLTEQHIAWLLRNVMEWPYEEKGITSLMALVYALTFQNDLQERDPIRGAVDFQLVPYITSPDQQIAERVRLMLKATEGQGR